MPAWRTLCSRDAHVDHVILFLILFLVPKISNAVRSAISATAGFLLNIGVMLAVFYSRGTSPCFIDVL